MSAIAATAPNTPTATQIVAQTRADWQPASRKFILEVIRLQRGAYP